MSEYRSFKYKLNTKISALLISSSVKPFKCSFDVRIKDQLSEQDLSLVSNKIKDESPVVDNIFISYYLPCMKIGNGSWATARFTPELSLSVQSYMLTENPSCQAKENE